MPKGLFWSEEDTEWLRLNYQELGAKKCAVVLNRTPDTTRVKACHLKIKRKGIGRLPRSNFIDGYIYFSDVNIKIALHRKIMGEHIGRKLTANEIVHHKNGNKLDNSIENLEILTRSEHMIHHYKSRKIDVLGKFI